MKQLSAGKNIAASNQSFFVYFLKNTKKQQIQFYNFCLAWRGVRTYDLCSICGVHVLMKEFDENIYCIYDMKIKHHTLGTVPKVKIAVKN